MLVLMNVVIVSDNVTDEAMHGCQRIVEGFKSPVKSYSTLGKSIPRNEIQALVNPSHEYASLKFECKNYISI